MATEYQREVAALDVAIPASNTVDSVNDILLDQIKPRLPASGTISTIAASDIPLAVPAADATTNTDERDVIGNKTDTAVTTVGTTKSIIAYIKGLLGMIVPSRTAVTATGVIVEDGTSGTPSIVAVATNAAANTFGSWVELDTSASADSWLRGINVGLSGNWANNTNVIEIGTGAAASEASKARISFYTAAGIFTGLFTLSIPIKIASGTRIAARTACGGGGQTIQVGISIYQSLET